MRPAIILTTYGRRERDELYRAQPEDGRDDFAAIIQAHATQIGHWQKRGLVEIAKRRGVSLSAVIHDAIKTYLAAEGITRPETPPPGNRRRHRKVVINIDGEPPNAGLLHGILSALNTLRGRD